MTEGSVYRLSKLTLRKFTWKGLAKPVYRTNNTNPEILQITNNYIEGVMQWGHI